MIFENQTLEMYNVLSYRGKMTQQQMNVKSQEISKLIELSGAHKNGFVATSTFSIEQAADGALMDVEILVPLDREIAVPAGYMWKPRFLLTNALMVRHVGNLSLLGAAVNELNAYILEHKLVPISTGYNVTVKEAKTPLELEQMEIEVYVGISPNIL